MNRKLRLFLIAAVCLTTGIHHAFPQAPAADVAEEAAQKQSWESCKAALEANGEHLDFSYFIPSPVPDDKNFALTPLMKPLLDYTSTVDPQTGGYVIRDPNPPVRKISPKVEGTKAAYPASKGWQTGNARQLEAWQAYYRASLPGMGLSKSPAEDMLTVFGRFDGMFTELRQELGSHPLCRYPLHYELMASMAMPHLSALQSMVTVLSLRASAELDTNHPDAALADLQLAFQLLNTIRDEPVLISGLVRASALNILLQPVWEGIASHRWNEGQLAALEKNLRGWNLPADFDLYMRTERGFQNWLCEKVRNDPKWMEDTSHMAIFIPSDLMQLTGAAFRTAIYRNQILINTMIQEKFLAIMDEKKQTANVARAKDAQKAVDDLQASPSTCFVKLTQPVYYSLAVKFATMQAYVNEGAVACEIERYRVAHGALPSTLDELHMADLPHDVINGQPLHYRVTGDDYILYSVGWNGTDDGGKVTLNAKGLIDADTSKQGDWVWSLKPL